MYKQLRKFDQTKAGTVRGYCLRNVRLGYGIAPKYDTAWQSWQNADRHTSSPIPTGVDVPCYFWWGKPGHIGVRLASGKFWSDGKVYSSLSAYRITHPAVIYKGWATEVNDVHVIKNEFPKTVTVTVSILNVRSKPTTSSTKVSTLKKGATVKVVDGVKGQSVSGISLWYKTSAGNYIWSGGAK